jgi:hypothetical protein
MKQIGVSILAVIVCIIGFRIFSPAQEAAPTHVYHIAYLLARNTKFEVEFEKPEKLFSQLKSHKIDVVYSWNDLLAAHKRQPLDALVMHNSAIPMVDFEWVAQAYWEGMELSTIGIRPSMLAHLFDDGCLPYGFELPVPEEGTYFTISTHLILSLHDQGQVTKWFRRDWRRNCFAGYPDEVKKATDVSGYYASGPLVDSNFFQEFMIEELNWAKEAREHFIEQNKDLITPSMPR